MARATDLTQFATIIRRLSAFTPADDLRATLTAEFGKILETAIRYTPKADVKKIEADVARDTKIKFEGGKSDAGHVYTTRAGKTWFRGEVDDDWQLIQRWRVPDAVWRQYLQALRQDNDDLKRTVDRRIRDALARRGLTAKTWAQIAEALGVSVKAPDFVQSATIPPGVGSATVETGGKTLAITGTNASQVLIKTRTGQGMIDRAIRARVKFLETAIRKGGLDSIENRVKSFPHLFRAGTG